MKCLNAQDDCRRVYLDNAATERLLPCVCTAMTEILTQSATGELGNPAALHSAGYRANQLIEEARIDVAKLVNAEPEEIIFTSGGTEANNTVIEIFRGKNISVSSIEHPSILAPARARAGELQLIPVDEYGFINPAEIPRDADLVSVMLANNELGTLPFMTHDAAYASPLVAFGRDETKNATKLVAQDARSMKTDAQATLGETKFHTDATQAIGKIPVDVRELGVDYLSFSAHKLGGPLGVGVLYVRKGAPFKNLFYGGKQESGRRAGTSNVLGIVGLGVAARYAYEHETPQLYATKVRPLRDELRERILREVPGSSANSPRENCLPNILSMSFRAAEGESLQLYLDAEGIIVGTGSACAAGDLKASHVLMSTRGDAEVAHSSIRFSLGLDTTSDDIERIMAVLPAAVRKLQDMSTIKIGDKK